MQIIKQTTVFIQTSEMKQIIAKAISDSQKMNCEVLDINYKAMISTESGYEVNCVLTERSGQ
jgi:hypothetical protein